MKKKADLMVLGCVLCLLLVWGVGTGYAAVTGVCSECHTMHDSQNSGDVVADGAGPLGALLNQTCMGCHSSTNGGDATVSGAPIVYNTAVPSYGYNANEGLAAGNFHYCNDGSTESHRGHNVAIVDTTIADSNMGANSPPGFKTLGTNKPSAFTGTATNWGPASWDSVSAQQVECGGEFGCHGNRDTGNDSYDSVRGGHHGDDSTIDGSTIAQSYRFLAGIDGAEAADWEQTPTSSAHNGYQGNASYSSDNTISYLCGECHGNYHANSTLGGEALVGALTDTAAWLRHPTDIPLFASTGGVFTTDYVAYNVETPVAYTSPAINTTVVNDSSIVMCLSCHRAHASPHSDILRFTYNMDAGGAGTTGCLRCHTRQR